MGLVLVYAIDIVRSKRSDNGINMISRIAVAQTVLPRLVDDLDAMQQVCLQLYHVLPVGVIRIVRRNVQALEVA